MNLNSKQGTTITITCKNTTLNRQISVKGTELIKLPADNCQGSSPSFIFWFIENFDRNWHFSVPCHSIPWELAWITVAYKRGIRKFAENDSAHAGRLSFTKKIDVHDIQQKISWTSICATEWYPKLPYRDLSCMCSISARFSTSMHKFSVKKWQNLSIHHNNHHGLSVHYAVQPPVAGVKDKPRRPRRPPSAPPMTEDGVSLINKS